MKLLFSTDWLRRKIAADPDIDIEAGPPLCEKEDAHFDAPEIEGATVEQLNGWKLVPEDFVENYVAGYEFRFESGGGYTPDEREQAMLIDFGHGLLGALDDASPPSSINAEMLAALKALSEDIVIYQGSERCILSCDSHADAIGRRAAARAAIARAQDRSARSEAAQEGD